MVSLVPAGEGSANSPGLLNPAPAITDTINDAQHMLHDPLLVMGRLVSGPLFSAIWVCATLSAVVSAEPGGARGR